LIVNGETPEKNFYQVVEQGGTYGMATFDQYLADLFTRGEITEETAMAYASDRSRLGQSIDKIKAARGEKVSDIDGLELDTDYGGKSG
jgi:twitching motility protein PilT